MDGESSIVEGFDVLCLGCDRWFRRILQLVMRCLFVEGRTKGKETWSDEAETHMGGICKC